MKQSYLSLGSNLGDREANLQSALAQLQTEGVRTLTCSSVYETEPQDLAGQPWFLNIVVLAQAALFPIQLLKAAQRVERKLGRAEQGRRAINGPRPIDIDLLLFGRTVMNTPVLTLPHPRMAQRRFVLEPLLEIAPDAADPSTGARFAQQLRALHGQRVNRVNGPFKLE